MNSSIGWKGIMSSLFCPEFSSRMQQSAPSSEVKQIIIQTIGLRLLKSLSFKKPIV